MMLYRTVDDIFNIQIRFDVDSGVLYKFRFDSVRTQFPAFHSLSRSTCVCALEGPLNFASAMEGTVVGLACSLFSGVVFGSMFTVIKNYDIRDGNVFFGVILRKSTVSPSVTVHSLYRLSGQSHAI